MKKRIRNVCALLLVISMLFVLVGCGSSGSNGQDAANEDPAGETTESIESGSASDTESQNEAVADDPSEESENGTDILVVYFSRTGEQYTVGVIDEGNTAIVAKMIREATGADLFEVLTENDTYPMIYDELTEVAKQEQNDNARPAYAGEVPDLSQYDTIFIGAPVWWGDWPMIMYTFFEENADALSGKTLIPFCTHEGSGLSGFDTKLSSVCPGSAVLDGLAIRGNDAQNAQDDVRGEVGEWISELGL